jgi:sugar fermentation stimulation protein A
MKLPQPLYRGKLIRRYQRFLADVLLEGGNVVTAHCPNSGSMRGCADPESPVLLSRSDNPKRKLPFTWELVMVRGAWVGINTMHPNRLVQEAVALNKVPELAGFPNIRTEVPYGTRSRIDLLLSNSSGQCHVEVKNVTLVDGDAALFPDSVTTRGQKHLLELMRVVQNGGRGVIFFVVQRGDASCVSPADGIDPEYGRLLRLAVENGVEALAYQAHVAPEEIYLVRPLPVVLRNLIHAES